MKKENKKENKKDEKENKNEKKDIEKDIEKAEENDIENDIEKDEEKDEENIDFDAEVEKIFKDIILAGKGKCCVCHHDLDTHIDEGTHWRCHSLGADAFQCECNLSKAKADNDIIFYDLGKRAEEQLEDLKKDIDF